MSRPASPASVPAHLRAAASLPAAAALTTTSFAIAAGLMVSVGQHQPWTVLPLGTALTVAALRWLRPTPAHDPNPRRSAAGALVAVGGALAWFAANLYWAAEFLLDRRDPGFLTLQGLWLVDHGSTNLPTLGSVAAAATQSNVLADRSQSWNLAGDVIQPQGAKMGPATQAIGGWLFGDWGVMHANLAIGAAGLLAIYALARRFLGPFQALLAPTILGGSIALLWLSRANYTEPLVLVLGVTAVLLAWEAIGRSSATHALAAAAVAGMITFIRIDGPAATLGVVAGLAVGLAAGAHRSARWRASVILAAAALATAVTAAGNGAARYWAEAYVERLGDRHGLLMAAVYTGIAVVAIGASIPWRELAARVGPGAKRAAGLVRASAPWLVVALFAFLASRPLWMTAHGFADSPREFIVWLQQRAGWEEDPTRSYDEQTITWISYHFGWVVLAAGVAGIAVMTARLVGGRAEWAAPLAGFMAPALLYLWVPTIVPDQVWAIRRLLPAAMVVLALGAAVAWAAALRRLRLPGDSQTAWLTAAVLAASPLVMWFTPRLDASAPVWLTSTAYVAEQRGADASVDALCDAIGGRPVVLAGRTEYFGAIRVRCDVPIVLALVPVDAVALSEMAEIWGEPPVVLAGNTDLVPWSATPTEPTLESVYVTSLYALDGLPRDATIVYNDWYVGETQPDGAVSPVAPAP